MWHLYRFVAGESRSPLILVSLLRLLVVVVAVVIWADHSLNHSLAITCLGNFLTLELFIARLVSLVLFLWGYHQSHSSRQNYLIIDFFHSHWFSCCWSRIRLILPLLLSDKDLHYLFYSHATEPTRIIFQIYPTHVRLGWKLKTLQFVALVFLRRRLVWRRFKWLHRRNTLCRRGLQKSFLSENLYSPVYILSWRVVSTVKCVSVNFCGVRFSQCIELGWALLGTIVILQTFGDICRDSSMNNFELLLNLISSPVALFPPFSRESRKWKLERFGTVQIIPTVCSRNANITVG